MTWRTPSKGIINYCLPLSLQIDLRRLAITLLFSSILWSLTFKDATVCVCSLPLAAHPVLVDSSTWIRHVRRPRPLAAANLPYGTWRQKQTTRSTACKCAVAAFKFGIPNDLIVSDYVCHLPVTFPEEAIQPPRDRWHNIMERRSLLQSLY